MDTWLCSQSYWTQLTEVYSVMHAPIPPSLQIRLDQVFLAPVDLAFAEVSVSVCVLLWPFCLSS